MLAVPLTTDAKLKIVCGSALVASAVHVADHAQEEVAYVVSIAVADSDAGLQRFSV